MKYIFVSDIHGSVDGLNRVIDIYINEKADKLILLGDTAASMDREANEEIAKLLNGLKEKVEVIRGNCDTIAFEELLDFEMYDMDILYINGKFVTITHGHYYNTTELPPNCGEIFIQGHTHVPMLQKQNGKILGNPGSISRPRGTDLRCYIVINNDDIELKTLDGKMVKSINLNENISE